MEEYSEIEEFELQLNEICKRVLRETAKWAYFLSILGYIGIGFIVFYSILRELFCIISNLSQGIIWSDGRLYPLAYIC
jgi:hypothetical protein